MHVHILGICGTFMGGLALLAKNLGHRVTGSDQNIYPPMSEMLQQQGIELYLGHDPSHLDCQPDCVVVGNVMRRGMPIIEHLLEQDKPLMSGPEFLGRHILQGRHVLAVSGTHGKTTTSSLLTWILEQQGLDPGFLIGGIPQNFGFSARLGTGRFFVVEADEYDSAFFDKRAKFVHYHPKTLIINNLEFDHADIYRDLYSIQQQFHHVVRTVPGSGAVIVPNADQNVETVLGMGCWSRVVRFGWDAGDYTVESLNTSNWPLIGRHNHLNACAAIAAAAEVGIPIQKAANSLKTFQGVKRRMECVSDEGGIRIYDDFAHHPTAIEQTLLGLRQNIDAHQRILAVVDLCSNTMQAGVHADSLPKAVQEADQLYFYHRKPLPWSVKTCFEGAQKPGGVFQEEKALVDAIAKQWKAGDHVLCMSNGGFAEIHRLLKTTSKAASRESGKVVI